MSPCPIVNVALGPSPLGLAPQPPATGSMLVKGLLVRGSHPVINMAEIEFHNDSIEKMGGELGKYIQSKQASEDILKS